MLRRNPDAVAVAVIGFFMLLASIPKMLFFEPVRWDVTPLKVEVPAHRAEILAERDRIRAEIQAHREEIRSAIKESIRSAVPK
jgi:hypothetical protein